MKAVSAEDHVVDDNAIAQVKVRNVSAKFSHLSSKFMSRNHRELDDEFALVDVEIGAAQTASPNANQNLVWSRFRSGYVFVAEISRFVITDSFHATKRVASALPN